MAPVKDEKEMAPVKEETEATPVVMKTAEVEKADNLQYDLKNLCAFDISSLEGLNHEEVTRENVQLLVNHLFDLPVEKNEDGIFAELPKLEAFHLPREKRIPKLKPMTRWEKFAKEKGIEKRRRGRMVWNDTVKDWVPRWGKDSTKKIDDKHEWAVEVKEGQDPNECPFEKRSLDRALTTAKQKMREVRNKSEALGMKMPVGAMPKPSRAVKLGKEHLKESMRRAQKSSGSIGKFDSKAKNEKDVATKHKKKQFMTGNEKAANVKLMERVLSSETKKPVDSKKAAKWAITKEQKENREEKSSSVRQQKKKHRKR